MSLRIISFLFVCAFFLGYVGCDKDKCTESNDAIGTYTLKYIWDRDNHWHSVPYYTGSGIDERATLSGELTVDCQGRLTAKEESGMWEWVGYWKIYTWYHANEDPYEIINDTLFRVRGNFDNWDTAYYSTTIIELFDRRYYRN